MVAAAAWRQRGLDLIFLDGGVAIERAKLKHLNCNGGCKYTPLWCERERWVWMAISVVPAAVTVVHRF